MAEVPLYDRFSEDYDKFVHWNSRLAQEWPFLHGRLQAAGARRVLDVACGTGHHSLALAAAGYDVVGADLSERMIAAARQNAERRALTVPFVVAGFGQLAERVPGPFDAVLCLGNSLPHALSAQALLDTLRDFRAILRPGGLLITQNRNFDLVWKTRQRFMPLQTYREGEKEWLFLRFYDFGQETITFNMVTLHRTGEAWSYHVEHTELRPIFREELEHALANAGFGSIEFYGALAYEPFNPERSSDLVAIARAVAVEERK